MMEFIKEYWVQLMSLVAFIYGYATLKTEVRSMAQAINELNKIKSELFDRTTELEKREAAQAEINKANTEAYKDIKETLRSIEGILRGGAR
jgi:hypothetical protein